MSGSQNMDIILSFQIKTFFSIFLLKNKFNLNSINKTLIPVREKKIKKYVLHVCQF